MRRASTTLLAALFALGCAEQRHVRVVFEATPGADFAVGELAVTARFDREGAKGRDESMILPAGGEGVTLPADAIVLVGEGAGTLRVSAIARAPAGGSVASGSGTIAVEAGGEGRVGTLTVILAPGTDAGCGDGTPLRGEICYRPSWVRIDGRGAGAAVLDVDGDGVRDLVAGVTFDGDSGPRGLSVQRGRGGDRYDPPSRLSGPTIGAWESAAVAAGDLDGDGRPEVVVGGSYDEPALLARGTSAGLGALASLDDDSGGEDPRLVDLDGDGDLDVVTHAGHFVYTFLGDGAGALDPGPDFSFQAETYALDAREIDDRPGAEIVVSSIEIEGRPQHVTVLGLEGGELRERTGLEDLPSPTDIAIAELDGEAPAEVVTVERETLWVLAGVDGDFAVDAEMTIDSSPESDALFILESATAVRRTGQPDDVAVALSGELFDPHDVVTIVLLRPRPGTRTLAEHARTNLRCSRAWLAAGDVDEDGDEEVLVTCNEDYGWESNGVVVLRVGDAGFEAPRRGEQVNETIDVGDVDADGRPDLVYTDGTTAFVRLTADDPSVAEVVQVGRVGAELRSPLAVDLDGDGDDEVAALCTYCSSEEGSVWRWTRGTLGWTDEAADVPGRDTDPAANEPLDLTVAHLVPGAPPSLVTATRGGDVLVWGESGLEAANGVLDAPSNGDVLLAAGGVDDVPGDDVVGTWSEARAVVLFRGDGEGGLSAGELVAGSIGGDGEPGPVAVGDADGDGRAEIFVGRRYGGDVLILGLREGAIEEVATFDTNEEIQSASALDLDGDGTAELVLAGPPRVDIYSIAADGPVPRLALPGARGFADRLHAWPRAGAAEWAPPTLWTTAMTELGADDWRRYVLTWTPVP